MVSIFLSHNFPVLVQKHKNLPTLYNIQFWRLLRFRNTWIKYLYYFTVVEKNIWSYILIGTLCSSQNNRIFDPKCENWQFFYFSVTTPHQLNKYFFYQVNLKTCIQNAWNYSLVRTQSRSEFHTKYLGWNMTLLSSKQKKEKEKYNLEH